MQAKSNPVVPWYKKEVENNSTQQDVRKYYSCGHERVVKSVEWSAWPESAREDVDVLYRVILTEVGNLRHEHKAGQEKCVASSPQTNNFWLRWLARNDWGTARMHKWYRNLLVRAHDRNRRRRRKNFWNEYVSWKMNPWQMHDAEKAGHPSATGENLAALQNENRKPMKNFISNKTIPKTLNSFIPIVTHRTV